MENGQVLEETISINHIKGVLVRPVQVENDARCQIVFILHGSGGHRDYCYQRDLGSELCIRYGIATFRFDFRGCGDSDPVDREKGREIAGSDFESLDDAYNFFCVKSDYELLSIVGHSRGTACMFYWTLHRQNQVTVPCLINCSGRFHVHKYKTKAQLAMKSHNEEREGYFVTAKRNGKYEPQWIPLNEINEFTMHDPHKYADISRETSVYSIFGSQDHIVPIRDAGGWANLFAGRHRLDIITDADHNFYGERVEGKKVNYNPQVVDLICEYLSPESLRKRFYERTLVVSQSPRWHKVDGVDNFRDFGGYGQVRAGILFRSGTISGITSPGKQQIAQLGISKIFDLRSESERNSQGVVDIKGVEVIVNAVNEKRDMSPEAILKRYEAKLDSVEASGFVETYKRILIEGAPAYKRVLLALRDEANSGILIHCTAGKDRTGVICALILLLCGVDRVTVARDYELTIIGFREQRQVILEYLCAKFNASQEERKLIDLLLSAKYSTMQAFISMVSEEYGGAAGYFKQACGLSDDDLRRVRANLVCNTSHL